MELLPSLARLVAGGRGDLDLGEVGETAAEGGLREGCFLRELRRSRTRLQVG